MLAKFQNSAYRLLMKISAGWDVKILLLWIFLPAGVWKFCCSGYFCRLDAEILLLWIFLPTEVWKFYCSGYFCRLDMEILLLIKSFDRLGDLIYMVL